MEYVIDDRIHFVAVKQAEQEREINKWRKESERETACTRSYQIKKRI
jgi:hypothetical protein